MSDDSQSGANSFDALAEEFVARHRRGERPSVSEYVARHPELADDIRDLFPGLVLMEGLRPEAAGETSPFAAPLSRCGPDRLGDYRILREVGRGGMGVVYEAEQLSLGRHVALKVLPNHGLMNPTFLERFRREAKAAARLHHTNIVPVFGVGEGDGVHYYAMQFIQGQSLDQVLDDVRRLRRHPLAAGAPAGADSLSMARSLVTGQFVEPPADGAGKSDTLPAAAPQAAPDGPRSSTALSVGGSESQYFRSVARVGLQAADALAYAHRQGVLHRDVKPSNLLLDQQGTVWITDFGLAKAEGSEELTHTGDVVGTIRFMAPERFDGRSLPQSDVYSLGLTLYEMLTLRPAFHDANKARLVEKALHEPPVPPRRIDPHVPRDLETIVLKCLAKDAAGRYATADELADDLRRFLADRTIRARRASSAEQLWRWCRRNPVVAGLLAAVATLLVTVAFVSTFSATRLKTALTRTEAAEREARLREAEALVGEAHGIRHSRRAGQRFEALVALQKASAIGHELGQPPEWFDRLRNEAIAALALSDVHITREVGELSPGDLQAELNDDFTLYACTGEKGGCSVRRVADDTEVARLPEMREPAHATFGPGMVLAVQSASSGGFELWDLGGAEPVLRFEERDVHAGHFRPDGRLIVLGHWEGAISVYDVVTGKCLHWLAPVEIVRDVNAWLHPTEPFVAAFSYHHRIVQVRDLRSGAVVASALPPWPGGNGGCAWSPNGRSLLVAQGDAGRTQQYAFDPAAPALQATRTLDSPHIVGNITFHPAGDRFVARGWGAQVGLYDAISGQELFYTHSLTPSGGLDLRFDRTGERLAGARVGARSNRIGLWSFAGGREYRYLVHKGDGDSAPHLNHVTVHPGGRLAAVGRTDGVAFFDLETGGELAVLPTLSAYARFCEAGDLFTNGFDGCFRWPVRPDPASPRRLFVGPPQRLPFRPGHREVAASRDGRVVAQCMWAGYGMGEFAGGWILHPNSPAPRRVDAGFSTSLCSVSPDGHWVGFCVFREYQRIHVYEAATAERVWQSPAVQSASPLFTPDGRWLITSADGGRVYSCGTWQPGPRLGPGTPWDATNDLVVLGQTNGTYRLVELATGRELARLEDPEQNDARAAFTPDGTKLVVAAKNGLRVWDLRRIRAELAHLDLDWDAAPYPEATGGVPEPLEVKIVGAEVLVRPTPLDLNTQAWGLLVGPADKRDPARALKLIRDAVKREPTNDHYLYTLGIAEYRNGLYADAVATLEKSLKVGNGRADAFDLFFLAMCHARLGDKAKAKDCFDRAVKWWDGRKDLSPPYVQELTALKEEAESLLRSK
jgi:serine/threonine protein kinase/WD40 repeat protein